MNIDVRHANIAQDFKDEDIVEIIVTFAKSSTEFYGLDRRMLTSFRKLHDEMDTWYAENHRTFEFFYVPRIETLCAAKVTNHWRRAKVICHKNGGCEAYLLDSGEVAQLDLPSMRWLENQFIQFPAGASHFTLRKSALDRKLMTNESRTVCVKIHCSHGTFPTSYIITLSAQVPDNREICSIESSVLNNDSSNNKSMNKDVHSNSEWTNVDINKELVREELAQITEELPGTDLNSAKCLVRMNKVAVMNEIGCLKLNSWIPAKPITQSSFTCFPTYVSDELMIYFHDIEEENNLKSMRREAKRKFKNYENFEESQWTTNELCMAKYRDGIYYRGMILTVTDQTAEVLQYFH